MSTNSRTTSFFKPRNKGDIPPRRNPVSPERAGYHRNAIYDRNVFDGHDKPTYCVVDDTDNPLTADQSHNQAINRTEAAVADVINDLCDYIDKNKHIVNAR
ncbi:hypothetical protein KCU77_g10243, partial [Aureobasidium melanogenum]